MEDLRSPRPAIGARTAGGWTRGGLFPLASAAIVALAVAIPGARAACPTAGAERVIVSAISERGEIQLADGRWARLAGLDIPDAGRGERTNGEAARQALSALIGREVGLDMLSGRPDRWGRLLTEIFDEGDGATPASQSLRLLAAGLARVRPEVEARDCLRPRLAAEAAARANGLGVWTDPYYGVVQALDLDDLRQRDGQFVIVEGVVLRVGEGRSRTYLDFGRRGGFTVVVAKRQAKAFDRAGVALARLAGARLRVRGAMDNRFGLRMAISEPDQVELLSQGVGGNEAKPDQ